MRTVKMIHRFAESRMSKHKQFSKLSGPRMGVLFVVNAAGTMRMGDLATRLLVAPRTVTDLVDGLERDGFLKRVPDPSDRRAMLLELSQSAKANFDKIATLRKNFLDEIFSALTVEEQRQLIMLLSKLSDGPIRETMQEAIGGERSFCGPVRSD
jgi:DNA-binding MarR family transcriptional regulator